MASELNMYESQVSEYKYEIERLARELQEVKKKYFMQKKKEQAAKYASASCCVHNHHPFALLLLRHSCFVAVAANSLHVCVPLW